MTFWNGDSSNGGLLMVWSFVKVQRFYPLQAGGRSSLFSDRNRRLSRQYFVHHCSYFTTGSYLNTHLIHLHQGSYQLWKYPFNRLLVALAVFDLLFVVTTVPIHAFAVFEYSNWLFAAIYSRWVTLLTLHTGVIHNKHKHLQIPVPAIKHQPVRLHLHDGQHHSGALLGRLQTHGMYTCTQTCLQYKT